MRSGALEGTDAGDELSRASQPDHAGSSLQKLRRFESLESMTTDHIAQANAELRDKSAPDIVKWALARSGSTAN